MNQIKQSIRPFIFIAIVVSIFTAGYLHLEYNWQWYRVPAYLFGWENGELTMGLLAKGLWVTLKISVISLVLSILIGFFFGFCPSFCLSIHPNLFVDLCGKYPEYTPSDTDFCHLFCDFAGF